MNLPNRLTILRIALIPLYIALLLSPISPLFALLVFAFAAFTDWLDGYLARKNQLVSNFGKIMDPLADKLLITGAILCFLSLGLTNVWVAMIILGREFLVTGLRVAAAASGKVIDANIWGKAKTVTQFAAVIVTTILRDAQAFTLHRDAALMMTDVVMLLAAVMTGVSGVIYVKDNLQILRDS